MRNIINIKGEERTFSYLLEYNKNIKSVKTNQSIKWYLDVTSKCIRLYDENIEFYRYGNDWYNTRDIQLWKNDYVAESTKVSKLTVYIPTYSIHKYVKGIKYMLNVNTWINGVKIDLGSYLFKQTDTYASPKSVIKKGNNEYYECIDFDIIDPFDLMYSDGEGSWADFRQNVCFEPKGLNTTASFLNVSLFIVKEYDGRYMMHGDWLGGCTNFDTSNLDSSLSLNLSINNDPLGFCFKVKMNEVYNDLIEYLAETYFYSSNSSDLPFDHNSIKFELVLKNKDSAVLGPKISYYNKNGSSEYGCFKQLMEFHKLNEYNDIVKNEDEFNIDRSGVELFFSKWNIFEEGWNLVGSMTIYHKDEKYEMLNIISNELPITQEVFSKFINGGTEKIIDINDMKIETYNIVNKIENKIVKLDRQFDSSKSNIVQPVFFKSGSLNSLTLHPMITETIAINLDSYKSKVNKFILQIDNCKFEQIGANNYGILFRINANTLPLISKSGIFYVLNENLELITTGNYTSII